MANDRRGERQEGPDKKKKAQKKPRNYWAVVLTVENYRITRERGFTLQGVRTKERKKAQRMLPGDRVLFYLTGAMRFPATATVTSEYVEDYAPVWVDPAGKDLHPYRVGIKPDQVLEEEDWLDARELGPTLLYVRRWTPEQWPLAFYQTQLHLLPQQDFRLIEEEMRRINLRKRKAGAGARG